MDTDYTDHLPQKGTRVAKEFSIYGLEHAPRIVPHPISFSTTHGGDYELIDLRFTIWNSHHALPM